MSIDALRAWLADELARNGMSAEQAVTAASALVASSGGNPVTAATAVSAARALRQVPEGTEWWRSSDASARAWEKMKDGNPDLAFGMIAERLAGPAPDVWDPNWPASKVAWALLPADAQAGQTFVVGNGEGSRATVEIIEDDGGLHAVISSTRSPLEELWDEAYRQATELL